MKINDWLEAVEWTQSDLSRALDVTRSAVCRWCAKDKAQRRVPSSAYILAIQKLTEGRVRLEDWL